MKIKIGSTILKVRKKLEFEFNDSSVSQFIGNEYDYIEIYQSFFDRRVRNVRRYKLKFENEVWSYVEYTPQNRLQASNFKKDEDYATLQIKSDNVIFLLLESPHEHEFDESFQPIAPAQKVTGKNIEDHLLEILHKITEIRNPAEGEYDFCLINPVQSQTSLHYLHKKTLNKNKDIRHKVWNLLLDDTAKHELRKIINESGYTYKIVINACTLPIKRTLSNFLKDHCIDFVSVNHPSGWRWSSNRVVKNKDGR